MNILDKLIDTLFITIWDILPIVVIVFGFQLLVLRRPIANLKQVLGGFIFVLMGLVFFIEGLELALFPLGRMMARQLTDPAFIGTGTIGIDGIIHWWDYYWVYIFGATVGFAAAIAEPALMAVALKARDVSGGAIRPWGLRIAVASGASVGIAIGIFRIVTGTPLHYYIIACYVLVIVQTIFAPRALIALAYDSGGVTTSTVTVPLVAALGLGLASTVPGRSPMDGFGLIALTCLFPIVAVLGFAQIAHYRQKRQVQKTHEQIQKTQGNGR